MTFLAFGRLAVTRLAQEFGLVFVGLVAASMNLEGVSVSRAVESLVPPTPETSESGAGSWRDTIGRRVDLQLLNVRSPCRVLYAKGRLDDRKALR